MTDKTPPPLFPDKEIFGIGEACRVLQVPAYTLRYWETRLGFLKPSRRQSGHRRYTRRDVETLLKVKELVRERHMTLAGARRLLLRESRGGGRGPAAAESIAPAAAKALREARTELREILAELSR